MRALPLSRVALGISVWAALAVGFVAAEPLLLGIGKADVTGPVADVNLMVCATALGLR